MKFLNKARTNKLYILFYKNESFYEFIISFHFLFCSQKTVLDSIAHDDPTYKGDGYTSLAVIYAVLAVCNWLAPSIISVTGPKVAMIIGAVTYA